MNKLSVVMITKNEEINLPRCLQSVAWADEVVVVDTGSTDATVEVARRHGAVVSSVEWMGFGRSKQHAVEQASNDWVLVLDADEEVTPELKSALQACLAAPTHHAYRIKRNSYYLGRLIRHSGWQHDYTLRLFHRGHAAFNDKPVHESVQTNSPIGRVDAPMLHYTYPTLRSHLEKMSLYAALGARSLHDRGRRTSLAGAVLRGFTKFLKMYLWRQGFRDGREGFALAAMSSFGVMYKYLLLWESWNR